MKALKTIALVIGLYFTALIGEVVMLALSPDYQGGIGIVIILGALAFAAPKVGYRWFDCFFAAIPIYGIFFIFRIANRISKLPESDWPSRR